MVAVSRTTERHKFVNVMFRLEVHTASNLCLSWTTGLECEV
jgi:hypothetical protein